MSPRGRPLAALGPPRQDGRLKEELRALKSLAPYLWPRDSLGLRVRVVLAVGFLIAGKLVNIYVPFFYKDAVDALSPANAVIAVPVTLILAYGLARVMAQGFNELRNAVFAKVEPTRGSPARALRVPPYPCPVAALPSRAPHRRVGASDRARGAGHRVPALLHAVQRRSDDIRDPAGLRDPVAALRLDLCRGHLRHDRRLHRLHVLDHRLARALSARDERAQHRIQHQGRRQHAQFRDGQVFRQRGARGAPLRHGASGL